MKNLREDQNRKNGNLQATSPINISILLNKTQKA